MQIHGILGLAPSNTKPTHHSVKSRIKKLKEKTLAGWQEEYLNGIINKSEYSQSDIDLITQMERQYAKQSTDS